MLTEFIIKVVRGNSLSYLVPFIEP
jgi:hypothetical protein